ncbi:MAG: type I glutamate--ammonia ligase [Phycisphaerales bacterium]
MTPKQIIQFIKSQKIAFIDLRFMDFPGSWQHKVYAASEFTERTFTEGVGFDGSCVRGWEAINEGDMLLIPVAESATVDPFYDKPTLAMICDVKDPVTRKHFSRDPRSVARKAERFLKDTKIADQAMFSPELEFFVFDSARYEQTINTGYYFVDSVEGQWNRGSQDVANLGSQLRVHEGLFPSPPGDTLSDLRGEMAELLMRSGITVESHHHEVSTGGQCEIDLRHAPLVRMADACMMYKYVVKNVAARHGKVATFMPKPLFGDNGSGMHTHFSLWKAGKPLFGGRRYAGLSQLGLYAIGGILQHAPALIAFTNPSTNSFKRLVPGYEAPVNLTYSSRNRWAAIRIPTYSDDPRTKRVEIRFPDGSCNPYLAFSAISMAAIDGIRHKIDPGDPLDKDSPAITPDELRSLPGAPHDLAESLAALQKDHDFLLAGEVFSKDLIRYWIEYKQQTEIEALRQRPHPHEFCMYFDC